MDIFLSDQGLSKSEAEKLLVRFEQAGVEVTELTSTFLFFVHSDQPLVESDKSKLSSLLSGTSVSYAEGERSLLVVPRPGTISPRHPQATLIFRQFDQDTSIHLDTLLTQA